MPEIKQSELAAHVYKLLSSVFLVQPDTLFLNSVYKWCIDVLSNDKNLPSEITAALKMIKISLEPEITNELVTSLKENYVKLIRSPSKEFSPPPPYESVYLENTLWGNSTVEVLKEYKKQGLEPIGQYHSEPPDHIGLELHFMASLSEKECKEVELHFLTNHLLKWFPKYKESAGKYIPHKFYQGIFELTSKWISLHREYLEFVVESSVKG